MFVCVQFQLFFITSYYKSSFTDDFITEHHTLKLNVFHNVKYSESILEMKILEYPMLGQGRELKVCIYHGSAFLLLQFFVGNVTSFFVISHHV